MLHEDENEEKPGMEMGYVEKSQEIDRSRKMELIEEQPMRNLDREHGVQKGESPGMKR